MSPLGLASPRKLLAIFPIIGWFTSSPLLAVWLVDAVAAAAGALEADAALRCGWDSWIGILRVLATRIILCRVSVYVFVFCIVYVIMCNCVCLRACLTTFFT